MPETGEGKGSKKTKRTQVGFVTSNKMQKTIVVESKNLIRHPKYRKYINRLIKIVEKAE